MLDTLVNIYNLSFQFTIPKLRINLARKRDVFSFVGRFVPRTQRLRDLGDVARKFTNVFVKNFGDEIKDDEELRKFFEPFGSISSCVIMKRDDSGEAKPRGFGFVAFENPEDAAKVRFFYY